jgi:hypothetical protein
MLQENVHVKAIQHSAVDIRSEYAMGVNPYLERSGCIGKVIGNPKSVEGWRFGVKSGKSG